LFNVAAEFGGFFAEGDKFFGKVFALDAADDGFELSAPELVKVLADEVYDVFLGEESMGEALRIDDFFVAPGGFIGGILG
jgi:hypothetical protein